MAPLRVLELPLREPVRFVVSRRRRDPQLVVFGAPLDRFADNAAYLFLHLSDAESTLRCVWISGSHEVVQRLKQAGYRAELRWSWAGVRTCSRAGWFVVSGYVSDINRWLSDGAAYLNLWHGIGVKVIERDITTGPSALLHKRRPPGSLVARALRDETRQPDWLLSSTRAVSERFLGPAFGLPVARCLEYGYPRNDQLVRPVGLPSPLLARNSDAYEQLRRAPFVVGYFPTWRKDDSQFIAESGLSVERLADIVQERGGLLVFKAHFNTSMTTGTHPALVTLHPDDDVNAYLSLCSVLITDYSSVTADFLLLRRPVIYFVPDVDEFLNSRAEQLARSDRPAPFDVLEAMPGPLVRSPEQLYETLRNLTQTTTAGSPAHEAALELLWGAFDGHASESLRRFLVQRTGPEASALQAGLRTARVAHGADDH